MNGEELAVAVRMSRPMDGETFAAGLTVLQPDGSCRVAFYRYRNRGGIVGAISAREMATLAPGLVAALKADGAKLKAYLAEERGLPPGGLGSSTPADLQHRTRDGAVVCECNGANGADYARLAGFRRLGSGGVRSPGCRPNGEESGFFAVCAPAAREGGEGK